MQRLNGWTGPILGVLVVAALLTGCHRPAQTAQDGQGRDERKAASFPTDDAIAYGVRVAAALPPDEDGLQTQSKVLEDVALACLKRGERDRAFAVAQTIKGWQRGTACADVAAAWARVGLTNDARRALLVAEAWRALVREQTRETNMGWTAGRIRDHIAAARAALGETTESAECLQKPMLDVNARVVGGWIAGDTNRAGAEMLQTLSRAFTNKDSAVQEGIGLGVMGWADKQGTLPSAAADEIVAVVRTSLQMQPASHQLPVRTELVRFLRRQGRTNEAENAIRELETGARSIPNRYYLSTGLADAAVLWQGTDTNRAANLVEEAETVARQCPDATRSVALSHLGECLAEMGHIPAAQQAYFDGLAAAAA